MLSPDPSKFASLLYEGVYAIKVRESKNLTVIHDELGYAIGRDGGTAIIHWRRGNIPAKRADLEKLGEEIIRRSNLGEQWLVAFFTAGGHPLPEVGVTQIFPPREANLLLPESLSITKPPIPSVVGRESQVEEILLQLQMPGNPSLIGIDGIGGIGKTALAAEIAKHCLADDLFEDAVWISASRREYPDYVDELDNSLTFESTLNGIGTHLGDHDVLRLRGKDKEARIQALLNHRKVLIVLDNLETAAEPQDSLIRKLLPLIGFSKVLMTSRQRFTGSVYGKHLHGLDPIACEDLIQLEGAERSIARVNQAQKSELASIALSTGGSPLAIKLVVGQIGHLPLKTVLEHLREVRPLKSNTEHDDYIRFYKYLFTPSWNLLAEDSKRLLISMAHFAPGTGGVIDMIKTVSDLGDREVVTSIDELWHLSLVEVGESSSLQRIRYFLHALTQYFVFSDIVKII